MDPSGGELTREGRRLLERLPRTIEIRTFAAAFEPGSLARAKGRVRPLTFTRLRGGTVVRQAAPPVHVR